VNFYVAPESDTRPSGNEAFLAVLIDSNVLKLHMKNGNVVTSRTGFAKGSPQNPMTYEEVADKFLGNSEFAKWPMRKAKLVIEAVKGLEREANLRRFTSALTI